MSKRRPKTSLVNLLRNKKTAIAAAVCVVVAMGAYVGVHMYNSHAEDTQIGQMRGVIEVHITYGFEVIKKYTYPMYPYMNTYPWIIS